VSVTGKRGAGIPIILLHDTTGGTITIELKNGSLYRGTLDDAQDNMNCLLKEVVRINPDGKEARLDVAYIRGSQISFIILPSMLQKAPFFNRIKMWRKYKGHAQFGANTASFNVAPGRGGPPRGIMPGRGGGGMPGRGYPPPGGGGIYGPGPGGPPMPFIPGGPRPSFQGGNRLPPPPR